MEHAASPRLRGASLALGCVGSVLCPGGVLAAAPTPPDARGPYAASVGEGGDAILVKGSYARPDVASANLLRRWADA